MRDDNWQAMFQGSVALDPAIRTHLEAEKCLTKQAAMADNGKSLQKKLVCGNPRRIKEDDSSVPFARWPLGNTGRALCPGGEHRK